MERLRLLTATDLHQVRWAYEALDRAVIEHKPKIVMLVGDFLHGGILRSEHCSPAECAERLAKLPCQIVFVRGNHERENWKPFLARWLELDRPLHAPYGEPVAFGPLVLMGFPSMFTGQEYFLGDRPDNTFEYNLWISAAREQYGPAYRTMWLLHEPPSRTKLCKVEGVAAGIDEWREMIEKFSPWVTLSGHDHETPVFDGDWHDRIGRTICLNLGQPMRLTNEKKKVLHYGLFDFEFVGTEPALPRRITIHAFPWNERLIIPECLGSE